MRKYVRNLNTHWAEVHKLTAKLMIYVKRKPREKSKYEKKSAKVYPWLYSSTEQLQVAL